MYSCLTQAEMADLLSISRIKYLRKENGTASFTRDKVVKIARILKLDEDILLTYWMADPLYKIIKTDKKLAEKALYLIEEHFDDYDSCIIMPNKS